MNSRPSIVIIGAGLQGVSVALALAERGVATTVLERREAPMRGASHGNEGKIHLGLVYALDPTLATGIEMLRGAHTFGPLLDRWCGPLPWSTMVTEGFRYAVMPDSLAQPDQLEHYYERLKASLGDALDALPVAPGHLGGDIDWLWKRAGDAHCSPRVDGVPVPCFDTQEIAVDTSLLGARLAEHLRARPEIELLGDTRVERARRVGDRFELDVAHGGARRTIAADGVINCAWYERGRLDAMVDRQEPRAPTSYRVKHRVIVKPGSGAGPFRPVTMVQGPYGDLSLFRDGSVYLSWYPECRTYFDRLPPADELLQPEVLDAIATMTLGKMTNIFPALAEARILSCSPCVIIAAGTRDVDDPASELHRRSTSGPSGGDGWWSVDTGKLTLAPLHGESTARLVLQEFGLDAG